MIVIVDYDIGNVAAVSNMLMRLGIPGSMKPSLTHTSCNWVPRYGAKMLLE